MKRNSMAYTLGQAAKAAGISKTSLHRAIGKGRISAIKTESGAYEIEPSELHRVYPPVVPANSSANPDLVRDRTVDSLAGTEVLRREVDLLREMLSGKETVIDDLRERLDRSEEERRSKDAQLTALLTDQRAKPEPPPPPRRSFWQRFRRA